MTTPSTGERPAPGAGRERPDGGRRRVVGGLAGGVVAAFAAPARAADQSAQSGEQLAAKTLEAKPLENPVTLYPKPPFDEQEMIEWPGLTRDMNPRPDHGEKSYRGSGRLAGRKALITGGDSGIGRAAAIAFAREGADVAINYLPKEQPDADEVLALIAEAGRKGAGLPGDIRDEAFCKQLVEDAAGELGGLDILVNNAARQQAAASILDIPSEEFDATMKTNLYALFWITKAALPHLKPGATIINTTSVVAYQPPETLLDYSTTKGGIMIFTKCLAKQLAPKGIRVNGVAPGPIWTPLQPSGGQLPEDLKDFGKDSPMGRPGQPVELASVFVLLTSAEPTYATGQIYGVVGGQGGP